MRISIITVCRNSSKTIEDTILSVLGQTYKDIEYIIIDGGSTDETLSIIEKYKNKISKVVSEKDAGIFFAMNKGINLATGEIIGILNSDDVYAHNRVLDMVVKQMSSNNTLVCWGDLVYVRKDNLNKVTRKWKSSPYSPGIFSSGWGPPHPTFFVKKQAYEQYGLFRTDLKISNDYELMIRLLEKHKVGSVYIPETLVKMREGGNSNWKNLSKVWNGNREVMLSWKLNNLSISKRTVLYKLLRKIFQTI